MKALTMILGLIAFIPAANAQEIRDYRLYGGGGAGLELPTECSADEDFERALGIGLDCEAELAGEAHIIAGINLGKHFSVEVGAAFYPERELVLSDVLPIETESIFLSLSGIGWFAVTNKLDGFVKAGIHRHSYEAKVCAGGICVIQTEIKSAGWLEQGWNVRSQADWQSGWNTSTCLAIPPIWTGST